MIVQKTSQVKLSTMSTVHKASSLSVRNVITKDRNFQIYGRR
jgi:hypothetical protein